MRIFLGRQPHGTASRDGFCKSPDDLGWRISQSLENTGFDGFERLVRRFTKCSEAVDDSAHTLTHVSRYVPTAGQTAQELFKRKLTQTRVQSPFCLLHSINET